MDEIVQAASGILSDIERLPGSSSSWEMTVPRKELNMQVVSNNGGLFVEEG